MSSELDRKTEKLLEAYAAKRREQSEPPLELHLADRRLLQSEVKRFYGLSSRSPRWWPVLSPQFWPRLGLAVSIFLVLGAGLWALMQAPQQGADVATLESKPDAGLRLAKGLPPAVAEPGPPPAVPQSAPTGSAEGLERQLKSVPAPSAPAAPVPSRSKAVAQDSPSSGTTESLRLRAEAQPAPGKPPAPKPDTPLSLAAKGAAQPAETVMSRAQPIPQAQAPPPGTSGRLVVDTSAAARSAGTQTNGTTAAPAGTAVLEDRSSAPLLAAKALAPPPAPAVSSAEISGEQGSLGRELNRLGLSFSTNERKATSLVFTRQVQATQQLNFDSSLSLVEEKLKSQNAGAASLSEPRPALMASAPSRARSGAGAGGGKASAEVAATPQFQDSTMKKDWLARPDTSSRIDFEDRYAPRGGLLAAFEFEQDGNRVRIREPDGSIYEGQMQEAHTDALGKGERVVVNEQRSLAEKTAIPNQAGIKFRVSGTSRRLDQYVVIDASLQGSFLPDATPPAADSPARNRMAPDRRDPKAPVVTPAPRLLRGASASPKAPGELAASGQVNGGASLNGRSDLDGLALRFQGRALVGGTNEVRIDAVRSRP